MKAKLVSRSPRHGGILRRLARDTRGNAMIIMAAMIVPLLAFSGAAVDMGRLYVIKVRLQHACDAGALAGRKAMTDFSKDSPKLDDAANTQAQTFFANNFTAGAIQSDPASLKATFTKQASSRDLDYANLVVGNAQVTAPMTILKFFTSNTKTLTVTCQAQSDMADADTVFVLDMSNSMACTPTQGCLDNPQTITYNDGTIGYYSKEVDGSKLEQVRQAVLAYDQAIRQNADPSTHFRYGFAPYGANVNVGRLLYAATSDHHYIDQGTWNYQSRTPAPYSTASAAASSLTAPVNNVHAQDYAALAGTTNSQVFPIPQAQCKDGGQWPTGDTSTTGYSTSLTYKDQSGKTQPTNFAANAVFSGPMTWTSANGGTCTASGSNATIKINRAGWTYTKVPYQLADYVMSGIYQDPAAGTFAGPAVLNPSRNDGKLSQRWHGCVEDLPTTATLTIDQNNLPEDLNPDYVPTASGKDKWRPMWPDVQWQRDTTKASQQVNDNVVVEDSGYANDNASQANYKPWNFNYRGTYLNRTFFNACGVEARRLQVMSQSNLHDYLYGASGKVNEFLPAGRTYHDIGMKWGLRLINPTGVFADSQPWPGRNAPKRFLIFLTDGEIFTLPSVYDEYGIEFYDQRVLGSTGTNLNLRHTNRFLAECAAAKAKGITIQIVLFATGSNDAMNQCASPGYPPKVVSDGKSLIDYFKALGTGVAKLRISQ